MTVIESDEVALASEEADAETTAAKRARALLATRRAKMDQLFAGRRFKIVQVVSLGGDDRFVTPFGNKGRRGYVLAEEGNPENSFYVGETVLGQAAREYDAVELPEKRRRRRRAPEVGEPEAAPSVATAEEDLDLTPEDLLAE